MKDYWRSILITTLVLIFIACGDPPFEFVDGPEASDLIQQVKGFLVINQSWDSAEPDLPRLLAIKLPDRKEQIVFRRDTAKEPFAYAISGPDKNGMLAFIEDALGAYGHSLKTININGQGENVIFSRPGRPQDNVIGRSLALSPVGRQIAIIGKGANFSMPNGLTMKGPLEIWDADKKTSQQFDLGVLDEMGYGLSWFPDGKRLAYCAAEPKANITNDKLRRTLLLGIFGFEEWELIPTINILDVKTSLHTLVGIGFRPIVSSDGKKILVSDAHYRQKILDIETTEYTPISCPGDGWAIALLPKDLVIYIGPPTSGTEPRRSRRGSFSSGTPMSRIST